MTSAQVGAVAVADKEGAPMTDREWAKAEVTNPQKVSVGLRLDGDMLDWYKSQGKGYQTRINARNEPASEINFRSLVFDLFQTGVDRGKGHTFRIVSSAVSNTLSPPNTTNCTHKPQWRPSKQSAAALTRLKEPQASGARCGRPAELGLCCRPDGTARCMASLGSRARAFPELDPAAPFRGYWQVTSQHCG